MIYDIPDPNNPINQRDIIDDCPVAMVTTCVLGKAESAKTETELHRTIVLTQACDLANGKADRIVSASIFDAEGMVKRGVLKAADIKGPIRMGRVWGLYFLPAHPASGMGEMVVDLRRLHTTHLILMEDLCRASRRKARLLTPYREHLAKFFADTYCRIGLPVPYESA